MEVSLPPLETTMETFRPEAVLFGGVLHVLIVGVADDRIELRLELFLQLFHLKKILCKLCVTLVLRGGSGRGRRGSSRMGGSRLSCAAVCLMEDASDVALEEEAALEELLSAEVLDAEALSAASSRSSGFFRGGLFLCDELDDRGKFTVAGVRSRAGPMRRRSRMRLRTNWIRQKARQRWTQSGTY